MTKQFTFHILIGIILLTANVAKDFSSIGKMYAKVKACELNIDQLLKHEPFSNLESLISKDELNEIKKLKTNYCESIIKTIK